jgi:hypothetical protein
MKPLPKHLREALKSVCDNPGDDIYFALGYLSKSTARSYMSKLKYRGLAYTHTGSRMTEIWPTQKGFALLEW